MIKPLLLAVALLATTAHAADCAQVEKYADRIIVDFQRGVTGSEAWQTTHDVPWRQLVVLDAYEQPRYGVEPWESRQRVAFNSKWFIQCQRAEIDKND